MPPIATEKNTAVAPIRRPHRSPLPRDSFSGFLPPTSNTTYTPNQFFDVCIPHSSRGVVRLVAYMIRKTLGWCDAQGNPQEERILVSYQDLVAHAGISREMIREALNEAIQGNFVRCLRSGRRKASEDAGQTALYELRWDDSREYVKDPKRFRGFYEAEGNRTDIPNEFFDRLVPSEPLAVIKVVGSIIRLSIGFQARRGVRRQLVRLSYTHIQRYARIRSRSTLVDALRTALSRRYIVCLEEGVFDVNAGRLSRAAVYALRWADAFGTGVVAGRQKSAEQTNGSVDRSENRTGDRSEIRTRNGQKNAPEDRSEKRTGIETKHRNETLKQQGPVDAESEGAFELLRKQGFDSKTAQALAAKRPLEEIQNQIRWLPSRSPLRNPLGMLRRAIEEKWPDPDEGAVILRSPGAIFAACFYAAIAGNEGAPAAEPSGRDAAAATRYLSKLSAAEMQEVDIADLGRGFGQIVRHDFPALAKNGISLPLALRLRADDFYLRHQTEQSIVKERALRAARDSHEARYRPAWFGYLRSEESRIKENRPEDYARFQASRAEERQSMAETHWKIFTEERLARFDGELRRLTDFQTFFASEVLDFWEWDSRLNSDSFRLPTPLP